MNPNESKTPRTDAADTYTPSNGVMIICANSTGGYVKIDFARQLEMELNEANKQLADVPSGDSRHNWKCAYLSVSQRCDQLCDELREAKELDKITVDSYTQKLAEVLKERDQAILNLTKTPNNSCLEGVVGPREKLLSYFSWLVGGWNASPGASAGWLKFEPCYNDDEQIARMVLESHMDDVRRPLLEEIKTLKAELYEFKKCSE